MVWGKPTVCMLFCVGNTTKGSLKLLITHLKLSYISGHFLIFIRIFFHSYSILLKAQALIGCLGVTTPMAKILISSITVLIFFCIPHTPTLTPTYPRGYVHHKLGTAVYFTLGTYNVKYFYNLEKLFVFIIK